MTTSARSGDLALVVIDVQQAAVGPGLWEGDTVLANIARLLEGSRAGGTDVVFIQDDGDPGSPYEPNSEGWQIHPAVAPRPGERVVRKRSNSAFRDTELEGWLRASGIGTLVLVGLHTEYCFDTTCRVAFELGFGVVIPEMTNTTFDSDTLSGREIYEHHNHHVFRDRFATITTMDEAEAMCREGGTRVDPVEGAPGRADGGG